MNDETKTQDETAGEDTSDLLMRHLTTRESRNAIETEDRAAAEKPVEVKFQSKVRQTMYSQIAANKRKTFFIMGLFILIIGLIGYAYSLYVGSLDTFYIIFGFAMFGSEEFGPMLLLGYSLAILSYFAIRQTLQKMPDVETGFDFEKDQNRP